MELPNPQAAGTPPRPSRRFRLLLVLLALAVRAVIGVYANGRGEMEGLSWRYQADALAMVAGYGFERAVEDRPRQVDLIPYADSLARRGERLTPARVPPKDPAYWRPSGLHPPGYAWFLSVVYRTLGEPMLVWAKVVQAILDAFAALLVLWLGRRFAGEGVGRFAAVAYAVFPPLAYLVTSHVADSLMPALYVALFALFVRGLDTRRMRWFAAAGAVLGIACLLRPDSLLLPAFLLAGALALPGARARRALGVGVLVAAALLVLLPWGLRNRRVTGTFQFTTSAGGMSLYESLGQFPNPYGVIFDDDALADSARAAGFEGIDDPAANAYFTRRFMDIARRDPGLIVGHMLRRVPLGIAPMYHWGYKNDSYRGSSFFDYVSHENLSAYRAVLRYPGRVWASYWDRLLFGIIGLALFMSGVAMFVAERRRWAEVLLLWLPYAYLALSHLPLMLGARLLVPGVFGQFIMLGYWLERLRGRPVTLREI